MNLNSSEANRKTYSLVPKELGMLLASGGGNLLKNDHEQVIL
jgi:hypothetical protein